MKTKFKIVLFSFLITIFCHHLLAQNQNFGYIYPPFSRTQLSTIEETIKQIQIPDSIINNIPVENLIFLCMEYPIFYNFLNNPNGIYYFKNYYNDFNGFKELPKKNNIGAILISKYQDIQPINYINSNNNNSLYELAVLELLFTIPEITQTITNGQKNIC